MEIPLSGVWGCLSGLFFATIATKAVISPGRHGPDLGLLWAFHVEPHGNGTQRLFITVPEGRATIPCCAYRVPSCIRGYMLVLCLVFTVCVCACGERGCLCGLPAPAMYFPEGGTHNNGVEAGNFKLHAGSHSWGRRRQVSVQRPALRPLTARGDWAVKGRKLDGMQRMSTPPKLGAPHRQLHLRP